MIKSGSRPTIKKYDRPILIPRSEGYSTPNRYVSCTVCDQFAYCRVDQEIGPVVRVSYYCRSCVPNLPYD